MSLRAIPLLAALAAAVALVPTASSTAPATTEPNSLKRINVLVTTTGAKVAVKRLERGSIADFRITNRSARPIRMALAGVRSAVVPRGQTTSFFVHLDVRGKVVWTVLAGKKRAARGSLLIY
jgi:hypothetical protein